MRKPFWLATHRPAYQHARFQAALAHSRSGVLETPAPLAGISLSFEPCRPLSPHASGCRRPRADPAARLLGSGKLTALLDGVRPDVVLTVAGRIGPTDSCSAPGAAPPAFLRFLLPTAAGEIAPRQASSGSGSKRLLLRH